MLKNHKLQKYFYIFNCVDYDCWLYLICLLFMVRELGANVELLSSDMLQKKFPWLNVDDIELGSLGKLNSGW